MSKYIEATRKVLPVTFFLTNTVNFRKRTPDEFRKMENLLWNSFGPPLFELMQNDNPAINKTYYYKKHTGAFWMRFRNQFYFKDEATKNLVITFMPADFVQVDKLI